MPNILDYLAWRGDLTFERDGFNEVDNLIFSALAYYDFGGVVPEKPGRGVALEEAAGRLKELNRAERKNQFLTRQPDLLERAAESERYRGVRLSCYVSEIDEEEPSQFSAVVFSMDGGRHYVAFRGTDDNLAGWKEDFHMGFKEVVPAQAKAAAYLESVARGLSGRLWVGGHSKGGNLAVFAAAHVSEEVQNGIEAVFNNDGPGFQLSIIQSEGYRKIRDRIRTYIPKFSVVGLLLEHDEDYRIVASSEKGIMAHDPMTWEVLGASFVYERELSKQSRQFNASLRAWLGVLSSERRKQFVEALFDIIYATGARSVSDLTRERLAAIDAMIQKIRQMDKETRALLKDTILEFFAVRQRLTRGEAAARKPDEVEEKTK